MTAEGREALRLKLAQVLGEVEAATLMEQLPPMDWDELATKRDLEAFATKADLERFATKADLERFATKADLERFATKDEIRADLELFGRSLANEIRADFRLELNHAITSQTRTIVLGMIGSSATFASLVLVASRLG